jgi:glycosyltransferase involved in cell wall biosynthesis
VIYLFIHQNFPGQYRHVATHLAGSPGNTVYFITQPNQNRIAGIHKITYRVTSPAATACHPLCREIDDPIRTGAAVAELCRKLKSNGIVPDLIIGHSGWGEILFLKDVYPQVPVLGYFEFYYHPNGVDVGFDPEFTSIFSNPSRLRVRNAVNLMSFAASDWGHTATEWQRSLYPIEMQRRITAIHEGIDTDRVHPRLDAWLRVVPGNLRLSRQDEVVTYVSRNLEPYRGFHVFMRALPEILRRRPKVHVLIVGGDEVSYGSAAPPGTTYREMMLQELRGRIDLDRVHFLGQVSYATFLNLLHVSSAHVYLTYPFVLSWSFLEAMSCGCLIIGSRTPPVLDVLKDGVNGLAVDFFDSGAIADLVDEVLRHPNRMQAMRDAARQTVISAFDLRRRQLPSWEQLLSAVAERRLPMFRSRPRHRDHDKAKATKRRRSVQVAALPKLASSRRAMSAAASVEPRSPARR